MGLFDRFFRAAKPQDQTPAELRTEIDRAMAGLEALTAAHEGLWQIGRAAWSVDQDAGTITFNSPKGMVATAPVQIIGSYDTRDRSWLWGWDNPSLQGPLTRDARLVRDFGRRKGYDLLTTSRLICPEERCWELTALACLLTKAQGAYRGPAGTTYVFMTFGQVSLSQPA